MSIALLAVTSGCAGSDTKRDAQSESNPTIVRMAALDGRSEDPELLELGSRLKSRVVRWKAGGSLAADEGGEFGRIVAATTDAAGRLVVLDDFMHRLLFLDATNGSSVGVVGRRGTGPVELQNPTGLASAHPANLMVAQQNSILVLASGRPLDDQGEELRITGTPTTIGACAIGRTAFLRINTPRRSDSPLALVPLVADGTPEYIVAPSLPSDPLERLERTMGQIACLEGAEIVAVTYRDLPYVHAFTATGRLAWMTEIEPFVPDRFEHVTRGGGAGIVRRHDRPGDIVVRLVAMPATAFLVQVARVGPMISDELGSRRLVQRRDSYLIAAATGESMYLGADVPEALFATQDLFIAVGYDERTMAPEIVAYGY